MQETINIKKKTVVQRDSAGVLHHSTATAK